jgi:hypothetical protein
LLVFGVDDLDVDFDALDGGDGEGGVFVEDDSFEVGDDSCVAVAGAPVENGVHEAVGGFLGLFLGVLENGEDFGDVLVDLLLGEEDGGGWGEFGAEE